jgi:hypothetical protein
VILRTVTLAAGGFAVAFGTLAATARAQDEAFDAALKIDPASAVAEEGRKSCGR